MESQLKYGTKLSQRNVFATATLSEEQKVVDTVTSILLSLKQKASELLTGYFRGRKQAIYQMITGEKPFEIYKANYYTETQWDSRQGLVTRIIKLRKTYFDSQEINLNNKELMAAFCAILVGLERVRIVFAQNRFMDLDKGNYEYLFAKQYDDCSQYYEPVFEPENFDRDEAPKSIPGSNCRFNRYEPLMMTYSEEELGYLNEVYKC